MPDTLLLGLDVGGTSSRALLATLRGERLADGRSSGGNPFAHGAAGAAAAVGAALDQALRGHDASSVRLGVIGLAGGGRLGTDPEAAAAFERTWVGAGLRCPMLVVEDTLVSFVAGTAEPSGSLLLSGTGAIATSVGANATRAVADGHGWLLGDAGSGFWLGREAVRSALAALSGLGAQESRTALGGLPRLTVDHLLGDSDVEEGPRGLVRALVDAVHRRPPVELAGLAPLVMRAHAEGDPVASAIVTEAAGHLVRTLEDVRQPGDRTPVVLAGSILSTDTPVAELVRAELGVRWPKAVVCKGTDGAAGAAWLAALRLLGEGAAVHDVRGRLFAGR